jgi:Zn-dependent peptidase ImmA (M78 family)/transcriptional regulator with XRE-family HTH domain
MNGEQLRHAREVNSFTQAELAELLNVHQSMITLLERGERQPSDDLLRRIASVTDFPVEFFSERPDYEVPLGSLLFRKHSDLSSTEQSRAYRLARQMFYLYGKLSKKIKLIPVRIPTNLNEDYVTAAKLLRNALGYEPDTPVRNLMNRLESHGIVVLVLPEEIERLDAFSLWVNGTIPVIVLNAGKPGDRQRMNQAHELAHLVLHQSFHGGANIEKEAKQFASAFLLPEEAMQQELIPPITVSGLAQMKLRWGVALQALIVRARELDIITQRQEKYLMLQITKRGWRTKEPESLEIIPEKPRALRKMAELLYKDPINYRKMSEEVHLSAFRLRGILEVYAGKEDFRPSPRDQSHVVEFPPR